MAILLSLRCEKKIGLLVREISTQEFIKIEIIFPHKYRMEKLSRFLPGGETLKTNSPEPGDSGKVGAP